MGAPGPAPVRAAGLYWFKNSLIVVARAKSTQGGRLDVEPCVKLSEDASHLELGETVLRVLDGCPEERVPHPSPGDKNPLLECAGVKSWLTLSKGSRLVSIYEVSPWADIELIPTRREGSGFLGLTTSVFAKRKDPEGLGARVREALELCT